MIAYVQGEFVPADRARVPIDDRGFLLGDGVYDTCRVFEGRWFRFDDHARRLHASADVLAIPAPPVPALRRVADELLARCRDAAPDPAAFDHATLRLTLTRGSGGVGLGTAGAGPPRLVATLRPLPSDWRDRARRGWRVVTAATRHPPASVMPGALKGQGRVFALLARLEAERAAADDALLLAVDGTVTEGPTWNVFWRTGDTLRTPAADGGVLPGITRGIVMDVAREAGLRVEQGRWPRAELDRADEAFATMTSFGLVPLRTLDGREPPGTGEAVDRLTERFWDRVREESREESREEARG